jgi:hypothetical protein
MKKIRLSVTVDRHTKDTLTALVRRFGVSQKQIVIHALKLLELGMAEKAKGNGFLVVDADMQPVTRIVGL